MDISEIKIRIEFCARAFAKSRRSCILSTGTSRRSVIESSIAHDIKNVVEQMDGARPSVPIGLKQEMHAVFLPHVNCIVVNNASLDRPRDIDAARAVILADVVAHNRA